MKVAIYMRVSRTDLNLDNQRQPLIDYAKLKGWEYEIFEEQESTRKTRPVKEEVLQLLRLGKFDAVLVYKIDRWARSLQELIMNIEELRNRGKGFICVAQSIDTTANSGAMGMFTIQILGIFAEFEREMIRERTIAGLVRAKAQGKKLGRPFKDGSLNQKNYLDPDKDEVMRLYTKENKSYRDIANIMGTSKNRVMKVIKETPPVNLEIN